MATCKEVAVTLGRDAWPDEPLWRRLALRLHLWMCPHCRRYAAQIRAIGSAARSLFREHPEDPGGSRSATTDNPAPPRLPVGVGRRRAIATSTLPCKKTASVRTHVSEPWSGHNAPGTGTERGDRSHHVAE